MRRPLFFCCLLAVWASQIDASQTEVKGLCKDASSTITCDAGYVLKSAGDAYCAGVSCQVSDKNACCEAKGLCKDASSTITCDAAYVLKSAGDAYCAGVSCQVSDKSACCEAKGLCKDASSTITCDAAYVLKSAGDAYCAGGSCQVSDKSACCEAKGLCKDASSTIICDAGYVLKSGGDAYCAEVSCQVSDKNACCEAKATCDSFKGCSGTTPVNRGSIVECSGNKLSCEGSTCCEAVPAGYTSLGPGYCASGYYAGWVATDAQDVARCAEICSAESHCKYFSFNVGVSCSRYNDKAGQCDPRSSGQEQYFAYKKVVFPTASLWVILLGIVFVVKCCRDEYRRKGGCRGICRCCKRCECCVSCHRRASWCCSCCLGMLQCSCLRKKKAEPLLQRTQTTAMEAKSIEQRFVDACDDAWTLACTPSNSDLLELYGLYKQATEGDIPQALEQERVRAFGGLRDASKREAWASRKGMGRRNAMRKYIAKVEQLKMLGAA